MTSLRHKLWLGFGSLMLILLVVSALVIVVFSGYSHALERVFRDNYDSAVYCDTMKESLDELNTRAQQLIWEEATGRKVDFAQAEARFEQSLHAQLGNINLPGELEESQHLASLWQEYRARYEAFNNAATGRSVMYQQDLLPRYEELKQVAQRIANMNMSNMVSVDGRAKMTLVSVRNALLGLVIAGTVLAGMVVWTASRSILRPLRELTQSARQIEAGNLDLSLATTSQDEVGKLTEAFNSMAVRLREFKRIDHDRLVRTQQTTQLAIDSLPDAVFVIGPDDAIEIANHAARQYFGIEPGRNVASLGLKWLPALYEQVKRTGKTVEPQGYNSAIQIFVEGQERFLLPRAMPMLSADQRQLGVTAILVDVTQLRHVDEAKSSLVSTVSHELRTPLTSQRLLLGLLITTLDGVLPANQQRMLKVAKDDSDRLYRTIDDLLGISRMESGRAQFTFTALAPQEIVDAAVEPLRELFTGKAVTLETSVPRGLGPVRADRVSIHSALTNLLSNAIKFTPPGGRVSVTVEKAQESVAFSVADTGPGIPDEFRARIFEKFFRVPTATGPSGAGLGLSITKQIIEAHGGSIQFTCPQGGGTVFRFELPYAACAAAVAPVGAGQVG